MSAPNKAPRNKKGPLKGSGGLGRKALEGRGPTPKAEDRVYHKAHKNKTLKERSEAKRAGGPGATGAQSRRPSGRNRRAEEYVSGRNSVLEALRAGIPAKALHLALRLETDDRVRDILKISAERRIPLMEQSRTELDRMTDESVHQGVVLQVPPYEYPDADETLTSLVTDYKKGHVAHPPLVIALDGITDPRNLGAIIRSASAFGSQALMVPERRAAGVTATAWKTSAGAAARIPVTRASNMTSVIKHAKQMGYYVVGLDGGGDVDLPGLELASEPLIVVVGAEGKGLSRLVAENCDQIVSIPIDSAMESLNASMAVGIALYEISRKRSDAGV
ncbi:23S rRNA (guanosine(2251)-2'-O)-methyltransferase RlmB [Galactobacter caseinivorans]|uniref:23S rRNA (Guanosine(2251)-2'-O)-methyltransferase RlmB n=1 Tax=Galactobacter caseinivorans TaxID=2676123 RepID=A0A496PH63_9MICC|nr:23S rRNA (guanosine(2251)-2'-O)-methyltransferase RlmB [Galactobacter caseinivorans]RKW69809.1 23S rRNA (guanosine(2251)-2'-O)-methyltransferase RlmB [Galactobacter caseinivorans]